MNTDYYCGKLNMPGIDQHEAILNPAFIDAMLDIGCDVDEGTPGGDLEPQFFSVASHWWLHKMARQRKILSGKRREKPIFPVRT